MENRPYQGSFVALATPFTAHFELDEKAFSNLVAWHVEAKTDGIMVNSTTGEAPTLSEEEQKSLIRRAVGIAKGKAIILAGTGSNDTKKSVRMTEEAQKAGADGSLLIFPYYNRPSFAGCLAHFREIAKVGLPMMLYYHPVRTALKLSVEQLAELCAIEGVVAIKESPGDLELDVELMQRTKVPLFTGDDSVAFPLLCAGASGACSVIANIVPHEWKKLCLFVREGNFIQAKAIYDKYFPVCKALFLESNPIGIKYALSLMGKCGPHLRLPLLEPQEATKKRIREALERAGILEGKASLLSSLKDELIKTI